MKVPSTSRRTKPLPGMSVRDTPQASGTANRRQSTDTAAPSTTEFHRAMT